MYRNMRTYYPYFWVFCGTGVSAATMYPHTFGVQSFKEKITNQSKVDKHVLQLVQQVEKDLKLQTKNPFKVNKTLEVVPTDKLDFVTQGFLSMKWGAVLGIPTYFSTDFTNQAQENKDILKSLDIDIDTNKEQELIETFKLSDAAKKYALAKEIDMVDSGKYFLVSAGAGASVVISYIIARIFSPFALAAVAYCAVQSLLAFTCIRMYDYYNYYCEKESDLKVASIDKDFAYGGIEYYTSLLKRQEALGNKQLDASDNIFTKYFNNLWKPELTVYEKLSYLTDFVKQKYESD